MLTVLCSIAALIATWLSLAVDQVLRGLTGALVGIRFRGLEMDASRYFTVRALQGPPPQLGAWSWTFVLLSGSAAILVLALLLFGLVSALRSPGWLRGLSLAWLVVALLWIPGALVAAAAPGGGGPFAELYGKLGDPQAGRWTAALLSALALVLAAGMASRQAVAVGRSWMRADAAEFRRRLVRVTAGWPGAASLVALGALAGWASSAWLLLVPALVVLTFHLRTR